MREETENGLNGSLPEFGGATNEPPAAEDLERPGADPVWLGGWMFPLLGPVPASEA